MATVGTLQLTNARICVQISQFSVIRQAYPPARPYEQLQTGRDIQTVEVQATAPLPLDPLYHSPGTFKETDCFDLSTLVSVCCCYGGVSSPHGAAWHMACPRLNCPYKCWAHAQTNSNVLPPLPL